jgi:hypothetical protein
MGRKIIIALLALGAVAGFGAGFARLLHGNHHHSPYGVRWSERHAKLERHVAEVCTEAAAGVFEKRARGIEKP